MKLPGKLCKRILQQTCPPNNWQAALRYDTLLFDEQISVRSPLKFVSHEKTTLKTLHPEI